MKSKAKDQSKDKKETRSKGKMKDLGVKKDPKGGKRQHGTITITKEWGSGTP